MVTRNPNPNTTGLRLGARAATLAACVSKDALYSRWLLGRGYRILPPEAFGHENCEHDPASVKDQPICHVNAMAEWIGEVDRG